MKFGGLRSIGHNIAYSLATGIGLLVGVYGMNTFGEADRSREGFITVDFVQRLDERDERIELSKVAEACELNVAVKGACGVSGAIRASAMFLCRAIFGSYPLQLKRGGIANGQDGWNGRCSDRRGIGYR